MTADPRFPSVLPPAHESAGADLTHCDREPIHVPGSVQPHGLLCVISEPGLAIASISANVAALTGRAAADYGGQPLAQLLDDPSVARLRDALRRPDPARGNPYEMRLRAPRGVAAGWAGILHRHDGRAILELEPCSDGAASYRECFDRVRALTRRLQETRSLTDACAATVAEVRRMTGFGFVMVYRFLPDAAGQVIAEDRDEAMPSYVGLHFPASDIPAQARALYVRNPSRIIADARYAPAALVPPSDPGTGRPIDLSHAVLRSVSPVHIEYLHNMGMRSSMSASVVRDGRLWGLISCMDRVPRHAGYELRQACELMAQALAWQIGVLEELEAARHGMRVKALQARIALELGTAPDAHEALRQHRTALLEAVDAAGAVLSAAGSLTPVGRTPPLDEVRRIRDWLVASRPGEVFHTDRLPALLPDPAAVAGEASGLLAVPLSRSGGDMVLWFRPELPRTVRWGGDPTKAATPDAGDGRLHPRKSFAAWAEQVRGRSRPWEGYEVAAAMEFRDLAIDAIVRRSEQLERGSAALRRANDQLETFVQVASHDLLEPARQVETLNEILLGVLPEGAAADAEVAEVIEGIRGVSGRLRRMIGDLADYSQVGREAEPFEPVDLDEVLREAREHLARPIAEARARIVAESLPTVVCDRRQIRHVLLNLLSNAVKYRDPARPPLVRVRADAAAAGSMPADASPVSGTSPRRMVAVCVEDNGIGFEERHAERIFEPFRRLHGSGRYEGSGVGLAICRKIIERHGGAIRARSRVGVGSTFCFTLPARASYPSNA